MKTNTQVNNTNSKKKDNRRTPSPKSSGRKSHPSPTQEVCFSSSAFLNAPDPSMLPIPIFDDIEEDTNLVTSKQVTTPSLVSNKTDTLRQFLNIR